MRDWREGNKGLDGENRWDAVRWSNKDGNLSKDKDLGGDKGSKTRVTSQHVSDMPARTT